VAGNVVTERKSLGINDVHGEARRDQVVRRYPMRSKWYNLRKKFDLHDRGHPYGLGEILLNYHTSRTGRCTAALNISMRDYRDDHNKLKPVRPGNNFNNLLRWSTVRGLRTQLRHHPWKQNSALGMSDSGNGISNLFSSPWIRMSRDQKGSRQWIIP